MKFEINGRQYDAVAGMQKASLQTLYVLKVKNGIGMRDLMTRAQKMTEIKDPMELLDDQEMFQTLMVIIWLSRKYAGEIGLTLEEANDDFGIADLKIVEEEEPPGDEDPKDDPTDSDQDESQPEPS
jgi:hypothetical protein